MLSAAERFDCTVEPSRSTEPSIEMYKFGFSINFSNHFDIVSLFLAPLAEDVFVSQSLNNVMNTSHFIVLKNRII
jgi:hypothetical protein